MLGDFLHGGNELFLGEQALWRNAYKCHAHFRSTDHEGVAHVVACVAHIHKLHLIEGLMYMLFDGHKVGENLRGVVHVRKAVPNGHAGMLGKKLHGFLLEAAVFDAVVKAAKHLCSILKGFLFAHLAVAQEGNICAFVKAGHFKRAACAGRSFVEKEHYIFAVEQTVADTRALFGLKVVGKVEQVADLFRCKVTQGQKRASF